MNTFNKVGPVCLPPKDFKDVERACDAFGTCRLNSNFMPHKCIVSGWGATQTNPSVYPRFQNWAQVRIWKKKKCRGYVGPSLISKTVCAGNSKRFTARVCHGDSGGPLACVKKGAMILVGITSFGFECKETLENKRPPSLFTRVTQYVDWINQYTVIT